MKTVHIILGADMRGNHGCLEAQAKRYKVNLSKLKSGEAVVFINKLKNKLKAYSYNGVISYIRFEDPRRGIDMETLNEIPRAFSPSGVFSYTKALKKTLEKKLEKRGYTKTESI